MVAPARCTCGFTKFAVRVDRTPTVLSYRWRPVPPSGGLGSTQLGTTMGSAPQGWGRFALPVHTGVANTFCLNCLRVRRGTPVGGGIVMASFLDGSGINVVMTDAVEPSCMTARYAFAEGRGTEVPIEVISDVPVYSGSPLEVRKSPPPGAVVAKYIYRVALPTGLDAATYKLIFVDHCLETRQLVREVAVGCVFDVYGRRDDVFSMLGDYAASGIDTDVDGMSVADGLDLIEKALGRCVKIGLDIGGTASAPRVVGLQGNAVQDVAPPDAACLVWSTENNRWEPKLP